MAPNYSVIAPLLETVDRRGEAYNLGLGNASPSEDLSYVQGQLKGMAAGADFAQQTAQTARENDPQKLADDALSRQLTNIATSRAIDTATISNKSLDARLQASLEATKSNTRGQDISNVLEAEYGPASKSADIAYKRAGAANMNATARKSRVETNLLPEKTRSENFKRDAEAYGELAGVKKKGSSGDGSDSEEWNLPDLPASHDFSGGVMPSLRSKSSSEPSEDPNPLNQLRNTIANRQTALQHNMQIHEAVTMDNDLASQLDESEIAIRKTQRQQALGTASRANYDALMAAGEDIDPYDGTPNFAAGANHLFQLSKAVELAKDDPKRQAVFSNYISQSLEPYGGAQGMIDYLDKNVAKDDPDKAKFMRSAVFKAVARSVSPEQLPGEQKDIISAGLQLEHIEDPEKTYDNIISLISGNSSGVQDSALKNVMRDNDYVIAARKASKNGAQSFTIEADRIESGSTADQAGAATNSKVMMFVGADGTRIPAKPPETDQDRAVLNIMDQVQTRQATISKDTKRIDTHLQGAQQAAKDVSQVAKPVVQQKTPEQVAASQGADVVATGPGAAQGSMLGAVADQTLPPASQQPAQTSQVAANPSQQTADSSQPQPGGPAVEVKPGVRKQLSKDGRNVAVQVDDLGSYTFHAKPPSPDEQRLQMLQREKAMGATNVDKASKRVDDKMKDWEIRVKDLRTDLKKSQNAEEGQRNRENEISQLIGEIQSSGNADLLSMNGTMLAEIQKAKGWVGSRGSKRSELASRIIQKQADITGQLMSSGELGKSQLNTAAELQFHSSRFLSGNMEIGAAEFANNLEKVKTERLQEVNRLHDHLMKEGAPIGVDGITSIVDQYRDSPASWKQKLNPVPNTNNDPNYKTWIENPEFRTWKQFLHLEEKPEAQTPQSGGNGSSNQVPLSQAPQTPSTSDGPVTRAPTPEAKAEITSSGILDFAKRAGSELLNAVAPGVGISNTIFEGLSDDQKTMPVLKEKAKTDPEFGAQVEQARKALQDDPSFAEVWKNNDANFMDQVLDAVTPEAIERTLEKVRAGTLDAPLEALGNALSKDGKGGTQARTAVEAGRVAKDEEIEDYKQSHYKQELLADAIGFGVATIGVNAATTKAMDIIGGVFPAVAKTAQFFKRGAQAAEGFPGRALQTVGRYAGQVVTDATAGAVAAPEGRAQEDATSAGIASAVLQPVLGGLGALGRTAYKWGKDALGYVDETALSDLLKNAGVAPEPIMAKLAQAKEQGIHVLGLLDDQEKKVFEDIMATPQGQAAIKVYGPALEQTANKGIADAIEETGMNAARPQSVIAGDVSKSTATQIEAQAVKRTAEETVKREAGVQSVIDQTYDTVVANAEPKINAMRKAAGLAPVDLKSGAGAMGGDARTQLGERVKNIADIETVMTENLSPVYSAMEKQYQSLATKADPSFVWKAEKNPQLNELVANARGDAKKVNPTAFVARVKSALEDFISSPPAKTAPKTIALAKEMLKEARLNVSAATPGKRVLTKLADFGESGQKIISAAERAREGVPYSQQDSFGFLSELRTQVSQNYGEMGIGQKQSAAMLKIIDKEMDGAFKRIGKGNTFFSDFTEAYGALKEATRDVATSKDVLNQVGNRLDTGTATKLVSPVFSDKNAENVTRVFGGDAGKAQLQGSLKAAESAQQAIAKIQAGGTSKSADKVLQLGKDIISARELGEKGSEIGEALLTTTDADLIPAVKGTLKGENEGLLGESVLGAMKTRLEDGIKEGALDSIASGESLSKQIFRVTEKQYRENVRPALNADQNKLMDAFFPKFAAAQNTKSLIKPRATGEPKGYIGKAVSLLRRGFETHARIGLDLATSDLFTRMGSNQRKAILKGILDPDPAKANEYIEMALDALKTKVDRSGAEVVKKATADSGYTRDMVREAFISMWNSSQDSQDRSNATAQRNYNRRKAAEALEAMH